MPLEVQQASSRCGPLAAAACLTALAAGVAGGCSGSVGDRPATGAGGAAASAGRGGVGGSDAPPLFEPLGPAAYGTKVKDFLTGLPLSADELTALQAGGPEALRPLLRAWRALPEYRARLLRFFTEAFQQGQLEPDRLLDQLGGNVGTLAATERARLLQSLSESFARTALALVDEGRPWSETMTTRRFMLNVPLRVVLAYIDGAPFNDAGSRRTSWLVDAHPGFTARFTEARQVPLAATLDPGSPDFMVWSNPPGMRACPDTEYRGTAALRYVFERLFGRVPNCTSVESLFTEADWSDWQMVEIEPWTAAAAGGGPPRARFWDLDGLRAARALALQAPRVGFFTTPAFFANWDTNVDNAFRVTANQTLIVGLHQSFDPEDATVPLADAHIEGEHAEPGTACWGCHKTLDPMRDFFTHDYSTHYSARTEFERLAVPLTDAGVFMAGDAPPVRGRGVATLARALAEHPDFPLAWTLKLCQHVNFGKCEPDDPALAAVARRWQAARLDFHALVEELFTSPAVTFAARSRTGEVHGALVGIANQEAYCRRLEVRLGVRDVCHQQGQSALPSAGDRTRIASLSLGLPSPGYSRGDVTPVLPASPNLFFAQSTEKMCSLLADRLVENGDASRFRVAEAEAALPALVRLFMGVPDGDARFAALVDVLARHHAAALAELGSARTAPTTALRSTFVLACASPQAVSVGL